MKVWIDETINKLKNVIFKNLKKKESEEQQIEFSGIIIMLNLTDLVRLRRI